MKEVQVAFRIVKVCKTEKLPDGDAYLAWKRLCSKYSSKSILSLLNLKKQFRNSKLRDYTDQDEWITDLDDVQSKIFEIDESKTQTISATKTY